MEEIFDRLFSFRMGEHSDQPVELPLSEAAKRCWVEFHDRHGAEQKRMDDSRLRAAWAKLRGAAARLALVLHCAAVAADEPGVDPGTIDETSMRGGITLADWFGREARRLYGVLDERREEHHACKLIELIQSKGGCITIRGLRQQWRRYREDPDLAEGDLQALVDAGWGRWEERVPGKQGGHPSRVFVLNANGTSEEGPPRRDNETPDQAA
jgi:hypothetical protein